MQNSTLYCKILIFNLLLLAWMFVIFYVPDFNFLVIGLDTYVFKLLNQSLTCSKTWGYFWGYLNHPAENWLNLIFMLAMNLLIIALEANKIDKIKLSIKIIYFWLFFQLGLLISHWIFKDLWQISRLSPSVVMQPWVKLSILLDNPNIKDASRNSFPAGHTFVAVYWLGFTVMLTNNRILQTLSIIIASLLILPRLFSGAHWFTDTLVTSVLSLTWLTLALILSSNLPDKIRCKI